MTNLARCRATRWTPSGTTGSPTAPRTPGPRTQRLRVTLREGVPRVERVIDVPAGITLVELHEVLQVAIGWTDSHLHQFRTGEAVHAVPFEGWQGDGEVDERGVRLSGLPTRFVYAHDLGDNWLHGIQVLGAGR
jgi:hypothetical protein